VLKAKLMSAKVMDYEGIKTLLHRARERFPIPSPPSSVAGGGLQRRGHKGKKDWVEKTLGWSVESSSSVRASLPPKRCS
jgi:hypothetical protein